MEIKKLNEMFLIIEKGDVSQELAPRFVSRLAALKRRILDAHKNKKPLAKQKGWMDSVTSAARSVTNAASRAVGGGKDDEDKKPPEGYESWEEFNNAHPRGPDGKFGGGGGNSTESAKPAEPTDEENAAKGKALSKEYADAQNAANPETLGIKGVTLGRTITRDEIGLGSQEFGFRGGDTDPHYGKVEVLGKMVTIAGKPTELFSMCKEINVPGTEGLARASALFGMVSNPDPTRSFHAYRVEHSWADVDNFNDTARALTAKYGKPQEVATSPTVQNRAGATFPNSQLRWTDPKTGGYIQLNAHGGHNGKVNSPEIQMYTKEFDAIMNNPNSASSDI